MACGVFPWAGRGSATVTQAPRQCRWILLRGLARESAHWGDFDHTLSRRLAGADVHKLDLPGTGSQLDRPSPCTVTAITDAVRKTAIDRHLIEKPLCLLGLSLGAMVAWDWMRRYPDDVEAGVLMNTSFADLSPPWQRLRWRQYASVLHVSLAPDNPSSEAAILRMVSNKGDNRETQRQWEAIRSRRPVSRRTIICQAAAAATFKAGQSCPQKPLLLLTSAQDKLVSPRCSDAIHRKWRIPIRHHPWAGHDLSLDDGEWVAQQIRNFIAQSRSASV